MGYQEGADLGLDFKYPYQHFNRIKNHWRQSDPVTALFDAQPGMIASDSDDEKLYHFTGQSPGFDEILQENYSFDKIPRFLGVDLWSNAYHHIIRASEAEGLAGADLRIGLDETLRSLIICDRGDIATDFGLTAEVDPSLTIFSADTSLKAKFGRHTILPQEDDAATPTLAFGDGDTGFYESADNSIRVAIGGADKWVISGTNVYGTTTNAALIQDIGATATVPTLNPSATDWDTGIGWAAADQLSLIAGGVEGIRIAEAGGLIDVSVFGNLTRKFTITTDDVDGNETHLATVILGGLIRRGTGNQLTANRTDVSDTAANIVAAIPGCIVGSGFEFSIANEDATHTVALDGGVGVTMIPNDPSTAIPVLSTGRFLVVVTNATAAAEAVDIHSLGYSIH